MHSETQQTMANIARWLNDVVSPGDWRGEASFMSDTLTIHSEPRSAFHV
jgi:hypothetical protein